MADQLVARRVRRCEPDLDLGAIERPFAKGVVDGIRVCPGGRVGDQEKNCLVGGRISGGISGCAHGYTSSSWLRPALRWGARPIAMSGALFVGSSGCALRLPPSASSI